VDVRAESISRVVELDRDECRRLLAATSLGRLAINVPGWPPVIRPVNYVFDQSSGSVVFRSAQGSKFTASLLSGEAAFEIDGLEPENEAGWSVIVVGAVEEITNAAEITRLERLGRGVDHPPPPRHPPAPATGSTPLGAGRQASLASHPLDGGIWPAHRLVVTRILR
jgi:nitroimidazol reductase NimA-like FMN-containing flavoprotein (pyridoxamine 5'-phosphate oxidase superfamily)